MLRVSIDAKATVKVGPFSRGGKSRVPVAAADHDFQPEATVTPVGILLPALDELFLYGVTSRVTSDCLVDRLVQWWEAVRARFPHITTLVLNVDNGPENHSRRTQFMARLVAFARRYRLTVRLAYYPPYHSKYNPIERCWGILERHWNGTLLDAVETVQRFAETMTWKGRHPAVELVTAAYERGVTLTPEAMAAVEAEVTRLPGLEKWFVDIDGRARAARDTLLLACPITHPRMDFSARTREGVRRGLRREVAQSVTNDLDVLLAFYDFPGEHWIHLRTTNPIESTFATVRLRQRVTKGPGSRAAGIAMAFKLIESAQHRWRAVTSAHLVALVRAGATFENGVLVERPDESPSGDTYAA